MNQLAKRLFIVYSGPLVVALAAPTAVVAQLGTASMSWQGNDGHGWSSGTLATSEPEIRIRLLADWSSDAGYAFSQTRFDAVVLGSFMDSATQMSRPWPFDEAAQTLLASRFGEVLKIDDSRDTLEPGAGARGIQPLQLSEGWGRFDPSRPVSLFEFVLTFDGNPGSRTIDALYLPASGGNSTDRQIRIYTSYAGDLNNPLTTTIPLRIDYLPSPSALTVVGVGCTIFFRMRRRYSCA